jgi:hypothetical protein
MRKFTSPMINKENQELDGSSFRKYRTADEMDQAILHRVWRNLKPFGEVCYWEKDRAQYLRSQLKEQEHLVVSPLHRGVISRQWCFEVTHKGTLDKHFDMKALAAWYARNGLLEAAQDILDKRHNHLVDYFCDWDWADEGSEIEPWETGLILGYPVENTMKRCYDVKKVRP